MIGFTGNSVAVAVHSLAIPGRASIDRRDASGSGLVTVPIICRVLDCFYFRGRPRPYAPETGQLGRGHPTDDRNKDAPAENLNQKAFGRFLTPTPPA
jgi:hypothetical protein